MTTMAKGARSHMNTKRPWFITATVIIAISALNLFKTRRIITFFALPDDFLLLPRLASIEQVDEQRKYPIMVHIRESGAAARTIDLDWTDNHRLRKRDNEGWIQGEVKEYRALRREVEQGCKKVGKEWANDYNPNCNTIHASGMEELTEYFGKEEVNRIVGNGSNRDVWAVHEYDGTPRVLKTVQIAKKFDDLGLFDRNRRDAVASEQLSKSPYVMNIYGHCGYTAIYDFSDGGELSDIFQGESTPSKEQLLQIAYDAAAGVADSHLVDKKGRASIVHADIKPAQFLKVNGKYMLNDFNRARFLSWHYKTKKQCGFNVSSNGHGVWRAPEEYWMKPETEKIDVFSLGNVLFFLLTGKDPFQDEMTAEDAIEHIKKGGRVSIPEEIKSSTHPFDKAILKALDMCFVYNPERRSTARAVANVLLQALDETKSST